MTEGPIDVTLEYPEPTDSLRRSIFGEGAFATQDGHSCESIDPRLIVNSLDSPFYRQGTEPPVPRYLDISADKCLSLECSGGLANPQNTPASNSEKSRHGSSSSGSCDDNYHQDLPILSLSKAENLSFGWLNEPQAVHAGYRANDEEKARRRRQFKSSITDAPFGVFSSLDELDHGYPPPEEPDDTTLPFMRSPQFSPSPSFFRPARVRFLRQPSSQNAAASMERQMPSSRKNRQPRRRHIQRPFPYHTPSQTGHIPKEHTDRFPIPFPTIKRLPFRRETTSAETAPFGQTDDVNIKKLLLSLQPNIPIWKRLSECAMIRLSLHKSLPVSNPYSTSYLLYLRISRSTFSVKFSHTTKPDRRTQSPVLAAPEEGTMVLFQLTFLVPVLALRVVGVAVSGVRAILASKVVAAVFEFVGVALSALLGLVFSALGMDEWVSVDVG